MQTARRENEVEVALKVGYGEEPRLGSLAYDLLEVDRGFRSALREAQTGRPPEERAGWPRLTESPRIVRASANSPLLIEASAVVTAIVGTTIGELIVAAILSRLSKRPKDAQPIQVTINVDNRQYVTIVEGDRVVRSDHYAEEDQRPDEDAEAGDSDADPPLG